jgi:hypothetical protein
MESITIQNIFLTNTQEMETLDELHLFLIDYVHILEKRLKSLKKEVKDNPNTKVELKSQMSKLRKMRQRAYDVLDDLEYKFNTTMYDGEESSE